MGNKLYVGNLAFSVTESALEAVFAKQGTVESCSIVMDRDTGRSKGFGFIEMSSGDEAQEAIRINNGTDLEGRALNVSEARPKAPGTGRPGGGGGGGGGFRGSRY